MRNNNKRRSSMPVAAVGTVFEGYFYRWAWPVAVLAASALVLVGCGGCLLYTSPSPRDQRGSRMPSSA